MDRSNSPSNRLSHRLAWVIAVALIALMAASGTTFVQDKQDSPPGHNPNDDITFKPFGRPLAIDLGDGNERTLYMLEGSSPQDKRDPAHLTYYHDLALALVPREERLSGFPAWVHKVINRENETVIDVRLRLSSPQLRAAAEAKLLSDMRAFFDKKRQELNVPAIKVEVLPVPAYELRLYIQDRASGLTLASAQENVRSWTKDVTLSFRFNKESLATFINCEKEGTLQFTPYYKARAEHYVMARKQTTVNYAVGLKVKQLLDHRQRSKLKNEDENTILPILQDHVNTIARQIGAEIHSDIVATDPALITFLHSDTMLVSSCFDPANTLSFADFRKTYPAYTDEMLAEYLKPYGVTKYQGKTTETVEGKQHTDEKTKQSGGGIGFSLALGPLALGAGGQKESAERVLDTIYNATGIRLVDGGSENFYKPAEVKVYKVAQGYEEKKLTQASSVTVTKGQIQSYMDLSAFPQNYDVATVEKSLEKTLGKNDHVARLLAKKVKLEKARHEQKTKLIAAQAEQVRLLDSINRVPDEIKAHIADLPGHIGESTREDWLRGFFRMSHAVWGWQPPGGKDHQLEVHMTSRDDNPGGQGPTRRERSNGAKKAISDHVSNITSKSSSIGGTLAKLREQNMVIAQCKAEVDRVQTEIDRVTKEILSILER